MPDPISPEVPRAFHDPIDAPETAMALFAAAISRPLRHEVVAVPLVTGRVGGTITIVEHPADDDDAVIALTEAMGRAAASLAGPIELLVASVRPDGGMVDADLDRWLELDAVADEHGLWLLEWFVLNPRGASLPRRHLGVPSRW